MKLRFLPIAAALLACSCSFAWSKPQAAEKRSSEEAVRPSIIQMTADNLQDILSSSRLLVVDVYTDWCPPCRNLAPIFHDLSEEYSDDYRFAKLNAEDQRTVAEKFKITAFPTILFIKEGELVGRHVGFMNKAKFKNEIQRYLQ